VVTGETTFHTPAEEYPVSEAWAAGFPAHLWPAELVTAGGKDMLRLKDGTILEAQ